MCAGGIVKSWEDEMLEFNKVTDNILIQRNGLATFSYKDVCQVNKVLFSYLQLTSFIRKLMFTLLMNNNHGHYGLKTIP